jgi:hypothetical protein
MVGIIHTDAQMSIFLIKDVLGMYVLRVMVKRVTIAIARMEKSAACAWISQVFSRRQMALISLT